MIGAAIWNAAACEKRDCDTGAALSNVHTRSASGRLASCARAAAAVRRAGCAFRVRRSPIRGCDGAPRSTPPRHSTISTMARARQHGGLLIAGESARTIRCRGPTRSTTRPWWTFPDSTRARSIRGRTERPTARSHLGLLDDERLRSTLRGVDRGDSAAVAEADDDHIVRFIESH